MQYIVKICRILNSPPIIIQGELDLPESIPRSELEVNNSLNLTLISFMKEWQPGAVVVRDNPSIWLTSCETSHLTLQLERYGSVQYERHTIPVVWRCFTGSALSEAREDVDTSPTMVLNSKGRHIRSNTIFGLCSTKVIHGLTTLFTRAFAAKILRDVRRGISSVYTVDSSVYLDPSLFVDSFSRLHLIKRESHWLLKWCLPVEYPAQAQDYLTGFLQRPAFLRAVENWVDDGVDATIFAIRINSFKANNILHGYAYGDELLLQFSKRLKEWGSKNALYSRWSGSEFLVVLPYTVKEFCVPAAWVMPLTIENTDPHITVSVGIRCIEIDELQGTSPDRLVHEAEYALAAVKGHSRNQVQYFTQKDVPAPLTLKLIKDLQKAAPDEFYYVYQPVVDLNSGRMTGAEALMRWRHPEYGVLPPDKFIPLAEQEGLLDSISLRALEKGVAEAALWYSEGGATHYTSVAFNVTPRLLLNPEFKANILALTAKYNIPTNGLKFEITESSILNDKAQSVRDILRELTGLGYQTAIDDFGTGYSNFSYLSALSITQIKVDKQFLKGILDINDNEYIANRAILNAIITLGLDMGMQIVVEGIEDVRQIRVIKQLGATLGQGYFFGKPLSVHDFREFRRRNPRLRLD